MDKNASWIKKARPYIVALAVALLLELFFFNFRSWQSLLYRSADYPMEMVTAYNFFEYEGGAYYIDEGARFYLESLSEVAGGQVHNVYLDIDIVDSPDVPYMESGVLTLSPVMKDAGNMTGVTMADRKFRNDDEQSHYLWFAGAGQINGLSFGVSLTNGSLIKINGIKLNARQPVHFAPVRFLIVCLIALAFAALRRGSCLWQNGEQVCRKYGRPVAALAGLALIIPFAVLMFSNEYLSDYSRFQPYHELTKALCAGRVYLEQEPPEWMKSLENPYDETLRDHYSEETGEDYLWDYVYHDGHYYVYYGIVPCILLYLPYYLISGTMLPNTVAVLMAATLLYAGLYLFFEGLAGKIKKISPAVVLLLTAGAFMGCQMPFFLNQPDAYAVPVVWSEALLVWGMYLWQGVTETKKGNMLRLAAGSLLLALMVGCRPNMAVYIFLCIPMFWKQIKVWKEYWNADRKKFISVLACFGMPFVPVALGLMIYNAARFGSPFDFGYAYNLTVHDSVHVPFSLDKLWLGIYGYLLRVPELGIAFPFMSIGGDMGVEYNELGHTVTYMEYIFGGLLPCNLILLFIPVLFGKDKGDNSRVKITAAVCVCISVFLMLLDVEMGGVVYRYMADFSLTLLMAAGAAYMTALKRLDGEISRGILIKVLIACVIASFLFHVNFYWLSGLKYPLKWGNTGLYYKIYRAFLFW